MRLSEALRDAKNALEEGEHCTCWEHAEGMRVALRQLIDAVEETLLAQKKEADIILGLAELRRWGGSE